MIWKIEWGAPAANDMRHLDHQVAQRVRNALIRFAETGHGDMKRLRGPHEEWRLRVGSWRVRLTLHRSTETMEILRVLPRGSAYRD